MSLAEIKDALHALSAAELADIEKLAAELRRNPAPQVREVKPLDPDFIAAKEKVFATHHDLFRRLAE
jgi:hypothetical protein